MFNETAVFNQIEQAPEIEHGHEEKPTPEELKAAEKRMYDNIFEKEIVNNINGLSPMMTEVLRRTQDSGNRQVIPCREARPPRIC